MEMSCLYSYRPFLFRIHRGVYRIIILLTFHRCCRFVNISFGLRIRGSVILNSGSRRKLITDPPGALFHKVLQIRYRIGRLCALHSWFVHHLSHFIQWSPFTFCKSEYGPLIPTESWTGFGSRLGLPQKFVNFNWNHKIFKTLRFLDFFEW